MKRLEHKHPRPIRWMHWFNVPLLFGMIWSGLLIYWANDVFRIGIGNWTLFHFFPDWFYNTVPFGPPAGRGHVVAFRDHVAVGDQRNLLRHLHVRFRASGGICCRIERSFREAWMVILHDLHLSKVEPPKRKFNGAQQFAYTGVVLMGAGSLLTGLAIYKPTQVAWLTTICWEDTTWARWEHFWLTMGYLVFFVIHISQVIRAGWNNFRAMVTGYRSDVVGGIAP